MEICLSMTHLKPSEPELFKERTMGMASSDDEAAIMKEYDLMETIKRRTPEYNYVTHNMNEDMKAIYDSSLKSEYLNPPVSTPSYNANVEVEVKPARGDRFNKSDENEYDRKIKELKQKIEIAKLEKELEELTKK